MEVFGCGVKNGGKEYVGGNWNGGFPVVVVEKDGGCCVVVMVVIFIRIAT